MTTVVILGAGVMGTSFALPLSDRGMEVRLVGTHLDRHLVSSMKATRIHPRLNAPIGERVTVFDDTEMAAAFDGAADLLVAGVSTPGVDWAIDRFAEHMRGTAPLLLLTKGIARTPDRIEILPDYMARAFARRGVGHGPIGAIGGPCIAGELAVRRPTAATVGFRDPRLARRWAEAMSTAWYQLRATDDLTGLEICAALKNFYAIGVSVPSGFAETAPAANGAALHNAVALLFNQAIAELERIVRESGGRADTVHGLPGVGDLHVTCQAGRNSRLGRLMGAGSSYAEAMAGPLAGETVEGTLVAEALREPLLALARRRVLAREALPLAWSIIDAVTENRPLAPDFTMMHRPVHEPA